MIVFLIAVVVLALVLEKVLIGKDISRIEADHVPDVQLAEIDQPFHIVVTLANQSHRFVPFLRVGETFADGVRPVSAEEGSARRGIYHVDFTTWLRPRQRVAREIPVVISTRGRYVLREFQLSVGDFLGLKEQTQSCGRFHEVVVPPEESGMEQLEDMFGGFMGEVSVNRFLMEDPVLTLGYREYTGREPMKMISWSQSARGNGLMVKKYDYTLEPTVSVVLNVDGGEKMSQDLLETSLSLTRSVCALLEKKGVKYSFSSNSMLAGMLSDPGAVSDGLGQRHFAGILEHLGRATESHNVPFAKLLEKEAQRGVAAGRILITPGAEEEPERALGRLREASGGNLLVLRATEVGQ